MDRTFLADPRFSDCLAYSALWRAASADVLQFRPWCRPTTLSDCFFNLVTALVADRDITLVDADFSKHELSTLGLSQSQLESVEHSAPVHRGRDLEDSLARIRHGCRSQITLFTSGSTGLPKSVSHGLDTLCRGLRIGPDHSPDIWGFAYSPTHFAGVQVFFQALFNQNPLVNLLQLPRDTVLNLIEQFGVTHLSATPSFYRSLLPADRPLPRIAAVILGGERTDAALLGRLQPLFPNARFRNVYASTEAGSLLSSDGDAFGIPPNLADRIRLRDGRLQLHHSLLGRFDAAAAPVGEWYDTGDVTEIVSDTPLRFRILSRDRDWVNVGGHKINPAEVEAVLLTHPGVREARVFGRANPVLGNVLCADVVPVGEPPDEPELRRFLAARLHPVKIPRIIRPVAQIDKTRTGKVKRDE